MKNPIQTVSLS